MVWFLFLVSFVFAREGWDYQLYTNSLGNEYNRVFLPASEDQTVFKLNSNCSFGPLLTKGDAWKDFDIQYLPRADVNIEKYFGKGDLHPFVALQTSAEVNVGVMEQQPLIQARNVVAGLSIGPKDKFRVSIAANSGIGFHNNTNGTGIIASAGISKQKFGIASSFAMESLSESDSASKVSAGLYIGKDNTRYILEYDKQLDKVFNPAEISIGIRQSRVWNERDVFLFSSFAYGTTSTPGSAPRINLGITFNLQKNKEPKIEEDLKEDVLDSKDELYILSGISIEENQKEDTDESLFVVEDSNETSLPTTVVDMVPKSELDPQITSEITQTSLSVSTPSKRLQPKSDSIQPSNDIGNVDKLDDKNVKVDKPKIKLQKLENDMPENNAETVTAHEVQPSGVTPESLSAVTQQGGGDTNLSMLLAILAVVGGGAAWKFYTQYSEQKHEQKMKQMELDAKTAGLAGASPPPCQTAQAEMKAEIESLKTKVNSTAALLEDVDIDFYARKIKKLDKRLKKLEEPDEDE